MTTYIVYGTVGNKFVSITVDATKPEAAAFVFKSQYSVAPTYVGIFPNS